MEKITLVKTYKYRAILSKTEEAKFDNWIRLTRQVHNLCTEQRRMFEKMGKREFWNPDVDKLSKGNHLHYLRKTTTYNQQSKEVTILRREFPFLAEVPFRLMDDSVKVVDDAFQDFNKNKKSFYSNFKKGKKVDFPEPPSFSSRWDDFSLKFMVSTIDFRIEKTGDTNARVFGFPKHKTGIKIKYHTPAIGEIRGLILKKEKDEWYLCVVVRTVVQNTFNAQNPDNRPKVGVDLGVKKTIALSTDYTLSLPRERIKDLQERKKVLQRRLRNKKKGSKNLRKAYDRIAKIDKKVARIRSYMLKMYATEIARDYSFIGVEDLAVKNMTASAKGTIENPGVNIKAKSGLNREVLGIAPYMFKEFLKQKSKEYFSKVVEVAPHYTSQMCFECKHVDPGNRETQGGFKCLKCGHEDNADYNAAKNILFKAINSEPEYALKVAKKAESVVKRNNFKRKPKNKEVA